MLQYSALVAEPPENVLLLGLEQWKGSSLLVRLEHIFEKGEDPVLSVTRLTACN